LSDKDYIKDLFSDKLGNYEAKVNPELWNGIASQIGAAATSTAATGMSILTKWIIGVSIAGAVVVSAVIVTSNSSEEQTKVAENNVPSQQVEDDRSANDAASENSISAAPESEESQSTQQEVDNDYDDASQNDVNIEQQITDNTEQGSAETAGGESLLNQQEESAGSESEKAIEQEKESNEKVVNEVVHTPDPIVHEPSYPAEVAEEVPTENEVVNYSIGRLPNVFTPNGDGENDYFHVESSNLTDFSITVLNDQNQVVYQSTNPDFKWDGTMLGGQPVPDGNYVYFISAKEFSKDKPKRYSPLLIKRSR